MPDEATVIGAGPNGLSAAIELAQSGYAVRVYEARETVGGAVRSANLTLPGFLHDTCSAIYPLALGSPFFSSLPLQRHGLEFINPPVALAHPFDDGTALLLHRSLELTAEQLESDSIPYKRLIGPLVEEWDQLAEDILSPFGIPRHPFGLAKFGFQALRSAAALVNKFKKAKTRALFAGLAAHSFLSLDMTA